MVRLRLMRLGRRHRPFYRLNAIDQRTRRNGKVIENLGWFNPIAPEGTQKLELKVDRIKHWLSQGAQPSDTVRDILGREGILEGKAFDLWEKDRLYSKKRMVGKVAVKRADAATEAMAEFAKEAEGDIAEFQKALTAAVSTAKAAAAKADPEGADKAATEAEAALASAKKADEAARASKAAAEAAEAAAAAEAKPEPEAEPAAESE